MPALPEHPCFAPHQFVDALGSAGASPASDSAQFNNWSELETHLCAACGVEAASVCLLPDFMSYSPDGQVDRPRVRRLQDTALLVEIGAGYRARIVLHLCRDPRQNVSQKRWPPEPELHAFATLAREIYSRSVSDRVTGLMAGQRSKKVAWLYLDDSGNVESASANAVEFCRLSARRQRGEESYLPSGVTHYINTLVRTLLEEPNGARRAAAFALSLERGLVHCLLRRMAGDGFLLSIWRE